MHKYVNIRLVSLINKKFEQQEEGVGDDHIRVFPFHDIIQMKEWKKLCLHWVKNACETTF